ncbi:MAG: hypothetical protein ACYTEZ_01795 [Planctomycetota bacterium]|jgi:HEAT repeat protein
MWWPRAICLVVVGAGLVLAQDDGRGDEDDEIIVLTDDDDATDDGTIRIAVDPFDEPDEVEEPNRPPPVQVGTWEPPPLKDEARRQLEDLLDRRGDRPDDPGIRYRLADFYLAQRWFPQAEAEFLACARLDPESIRPWEGMLRVYRERPRPSAREELIRRIGGGVIILVEDLGRRAEPDWLPSDAERDKRTTHAYREIVRRRPDDVGWRRAFLRHLKRVRDHEGVRDEARGLLERLPGDADTRYELAEALRRIAARKEKLEAGSGAAGLAEAFRLLETNLRAQPDHAASALRLARLIAVRDGQKAGDRIAVLEQRAVFTLFVRADLAPVPYRADTFRMVRDLVGPRIAGRLWDGTMMPAWYRDGVPPRDRPHYRRWINIHFPHAQPRDRMRVLERLARRADREAAGILISFLWHLEGPDSFAEVQLTDRTNSERLEAAGIAAAVRLGRACYPAAERFLRQATTAPHRRRATGILRGLEDRRAVRPLLDALAWDVEAQHSYGVAATLEKLGDPQAIDGLVDAALDVRRPLARRREAAEALAAFKDARAVEALSRLAREQGFELVSAYGLFRLTGDEKARAGLTRGLQGAESPDEVVRLLAKCEDARVEQLLLVALTDAPRSVRPHVVALLKKRFWRTARPRVEAVLLKEAESTSVSDFALEELGEMGGADAAERLLKLVEAFQGERWAKAARALARTGDPRAVRYFSKTRILEKDPQKRRLAADLLKVAAARRAQLESAKSSGG